MVQTYDLFGQVAISINDVELYLNSLPNFTNQTSDSRRENYAQNYNLSTIIGDLKLSGDWDDIVERAEYTPKIVTVYQTRYVERDAIKLVEPLKSDCPVYFHYCKNKACAFYKQNLRTARNARYYKKKMIKKAKAEKLARRELLKIAA